MESMMEYVIQYLFFVLQMYIALDYVLFRAPDAYYNIKFRQLEQWLTTIEENHEKLILDLHEKNAELMDEIAVLNKKLINKRRYKCKTCELFSQTILPVGKGARVQVPPSSRGQNR
jgi:hypothetical protein